MIRKTLGNTQAATFCVEVPDRQRHEMILPVGTGFFVSPDGWFVTAAHVITENHRSDGPIRQDIDQAWFTKETRIEDWKKSGAMCQTVSFGRVIPHLDFALLKVDFHANSNKEWLKGKTAFPFIQVSSRQLDEGEPVYSFGYPLSDVDVHKHDQSVIGLEALCPRVTSAIVSSTFEQSRPFMNPDDPKVYILDKALNYGNSGGPIVSTESGMAHAFCSRFQPVFVPQPHLVMNGKPVMIMIPSLYGVVSSLGNVEILNLLRELNVPISEE